MITWFWIIQLLGVLPTGLNWALNTIIEMGDEFSGWITAAFEFVYSVIVEMMVDMLDVKSYVHNANAIINGIADLASVILVIIFLKNIFTNYILDIDGEADEDPVQSLLKVAFALAVVNCSSEIHTQLMKAEAYVRLYMNAILYESLAWDAESLMELLKKAVESMVCTPEVLKMVTDATLAPTMICAISLMILIWVIIYSILVVVLVCKILFRCVELFLFECLMPIFACDLITARKELWKPFFRAYLTTIFGFTIQYFCLGLSFVVLGSMVVDVDKALATKLLAPLFSTFLLFFAGKVPKWLSGFTYQTSGTGAIGSGIKGIASGASQIINVAGMLK